MKSARVSHGSEHSQKKGIPSDLVCLSTAVRAHCGVLSQESTPDEKCEDWIFKFKLQIENK